MILLRCRQEYEKGENQKKDDMIFISKEIRYEEMLTQTGMNLFQYSSGFYTILCILPQKQEMLYQVADAVNKWMSEHNIPFIRIQKGAQFCFWALEYKYPENIYDELQKKLEESWEQVYIGISERIVKDVREINESISLAEQITISSYYNERQRIRWFSDKIEFKEHNPRGVKNLLDAMNREVQEFRKEKTIQLIHDIFNLIYEHKYIQVNVLRRIFMDMLGIYSMCAQMLNGTIETISVDGDNYHYQKVMLMNSMEHMKQWFLQFEDLFFERFFVIYKCNQSEILKNVISYLGEHMNEQIYLNKTADAVGVSGTYLSTVFKKEMGVNFVDYVNQEKIEAAKKMLQDGKMVYETAECLGFENSTYFSKVFKKYIGISPDNYRKNNE